MITPVVLCGGSGTRLWPLSRKLFPKQFVPLIDSKKRGHQRRRFPAFAPAFHAVGRLQNLPTALSHQFNQNLNNDAAELQGFVQFANSQVKSINCTDGLPITLHNQEVVHIPPNRQRARAELLNLAKSCRARPVNLIDCLANLKISALN